MARQQMTDEERAFRRAGRELARKLLPPGLVPLWRASASLDRELTLAYGRVHYLTLRGDPEAAIQRKLAAYEQKLRAKAPDSADYRNRLELAKQRLAALNEQHETIRSQISQIEGDNRDALDQYAIALAQLKPQHDVPVNDVEEDPEDGEQHG